mmetsp:Transcript_61349/g.146093  ORF Transcript_61349/g.146093 Transcript_61349/m.146093 type:complete len:231 (+) Transcript_61349:164-856(+)
MSRKDSIEFTHYFIFKKINHLKQKKIYTYYFITLNERNGVNSIENTKFNKLDRYLLAGHPFRRGIFKKIQWIEGIFKIEYLVLPYGTPEFEVGNSFKITDDLFFKGFNKNLSYRSKKGDFFFNFFPIEKKISTGKGDIISRKIGSPRIKKSDKILFVQIYRHTFLHKLKINVLTNPLLFSINRSIEEIVKNGQIQFRKKLKAPLPKLVHWKIFNCKMILRPENGPEFRYN